MDNAYILGSDRQYMLFFQTLKSGDIDIDNHFRYRHRHLKGNAYTHCQPIYDITNAHKEILPDSDEEESNTSLESFGNKVKHNVFRGCTVHFKRLAIHVVNFSNILTRYLVFTYGYFKTNSK